MAAMRPSFMAYPLHDSQGRGSTIVITLSTAPASRRAGSGRYRRGSPCRRRRHLLAIDRRIALDLEKICIASLTLVAPPPVWWPEHMWHRRGGIRVLILQSVQVRRVSPRKPWRFAPRKSYSGSRALPPASKRTAGRRKGEEIAARLARSRPVRGLVSKKWIVGAPPDRRSPYWQRRRSRPPALNLDVAARQDLAGGHGHASDRLMHGD